MGVRAGLAYDWNIFMTALMYLSDYIAVVFAVWLSLCIRNVIPLGQATAFTVPPLYVFVLIPAIFLIVLSGCNTYLRYAPMWRLSRDIFKAVTLSVVTVLMLMFLGHTIAITSRLYVVIAWVLTFVTILLFRYVLCKVVNKSGIFPRKLLIVGAGKTAERLEKSIQGGSTLGFKIVGFLDDHPKSTYLAEKYPILGSFDDLESIVADKKVSAIAIAAPGLPENQLKMLINRAMLLTQQLTVVPNLVGAPLGSVAIEHFMDEHLPVLRMQNNLASQWNRFLKRTFDFVVTLIGLICISPVLLGIAIAIKLSSPGPIVFAHQRLGRNGKHFPCYKFRTMVVNSQEVLEDYLAKNPEARKEWNENFKLKDDPRVTKIGAFLRKTSLDELPQLWNVLKGDMSLVGPRPIIDAEVQKYGKHIQDFYMVRPGITGLWQVSGRSDTTYEERVQLDSWYVRNWSVWLDIIYLIRTVKIVLTKDGAY